MPAPPVSGPIRVTALYQFATFDDPAAFRAPLEQTCRAAGVRGTLLLAREGVNGTIAGPPAGIDAVLAQLRALPGCADMPVKDAFIDAMPFHRLKVRLKQEIVSMGEPDIDPARHAGTYVPPAEWNALIARPDTIVIDTRNNYEVAIGTFPGAVDPGTRSFRDFPAWFRANRDALLADGVTKVAMFCTGGIRCEKSTAFLKREGVDDVFHLEGGILNYLETVPAAESRWEGECFVFDERVAVGHDLAPGTHTLCRACRMPVSPADRASPLFEEGISCPRCHDARDQTQRQGYAERHRQVRLAEARGQRHVGERQVVEPRDTETQDG
ncbi:rhodanese-related sulfurtransferase [Sphingomonas sp. NBWT7]|uniref:oxygen-dependent tRNA uridine(34) hydroxylase TrhO n=1 Tax=Sphingomonas sp. NBWT7 TaxID=2596913 RepID=UPI00162839E7|nr:rhodanese-related sulfurtransferase [Sphingomonas sp. NBWT7]QNE30705.1 rhodanese-related sulfurtransferase [Sphingomonas sp. NBWT7]